MSYLSMCFAFFTVRVVVVYCVVQHLLQLERGLHCEAPSAGDHVVPVQKSEGIVEALLTHVAQNLWLRREENSPKTVDVLF